MIDVIDHKGKVISRNVEIEEITGELTQEDIVDSLLKHIKSIVTNLIESGNVDKEELAQIREDIGINDVPTSILEAIHHDYKLLKRRMTVLNQVKEILGIPMNTNYDELINAIKATKHNDEYFHRYMGEIKESLHLSVGATHDIVINKIVEITNNSVLMRHDLGCIASALGLDTIEESCMLTTIQSLKTDNEFCGKVISEFKAALDLGDNDNSGDILDTINYFKEISSSRKEDLSDIASQLKLKDVNKPDMVSAIMDLQFRREDQLRLAESSKDTLYEVRRKLGLKDNVGKNEILTTIGALKQRLLEGTDDIKKMFKRKESINIECKSVDTLTSAIINLTDILNAEISLKLKEKGL